MNRRKNGAREIVSSKADLNNDVDLATASSARLSHGKQRHLRYSELRGPEAWRRDNSYILGGYHVLTGSWWKCWASLRGKPHNETVNILTHLFGALAALLCFVWSYKHLALPTVFGFHPIRQRLGHYTSSVKAPLYLIYPFPHPEKLLAESITYADSIAFASFFVAAFACFAFSAAFHASLCHSKVVAERYHKLDYVGIVFLITGTYYPALYYAFFCQPFFQAVYISGVTLFAVATAYCVLSPGYSTSEYRRIRTFLFIGLGLSGVVPGIHAVLQHGVAFAQKSFGFEWLAVGGALYIGGALLYAERIPERLSPGTFDIYGSSHQIFHVACLLAAISHYIALCQAFEFHHYTAEGSCTLAYQGILASAVQNASYKLD